MLILQRKAGESLLIGDEVEISVLSVEAGRVRLAIEAPKNISILRSELKNAAATNREAADEEAPAADFAEAAAGRCRWAGARSGGRWAGTEKMRNRTPTGFI